MKYKSTEQALQGPLTPFQAPDQASTFFPTTHRPPPLARRNLPTTPTNKIHLTTSPCHTPHQQNQNMAKRGAKQVEAASTRTYLPRKAKGDAVYTQDTPSETEDDTPPPPPRKRQKKAAPAPKPAPPTSALCQYCYDDKPISAFPPPEHIHPGCHACYPDNFKVCRDCMIRTLQRQITYTMVIDVICTFCGRTWGPEYLSYYLSDAELKKYEDRLTHRSLESDPHFRWCAKDDCISGEFYDASAVENPKTCCGHCDSTNCFNCRVEWHDGLTCDEFQDPKKAVRKKKGMAKGADVDTLKTMRKNVTKRCPHCQAAIERSEGCDHMYCGACGKNFMWSEAKNV